MPLFNVHTSSYLIQEEPPELSKMGWDFGIRGTQSVDTRSKAARDFVATQCRSHAELDYNLATKQFEIDGSTVQKNVLNVRLRGMDSILVDATSLNCPELINILRAAHQERIKKVSFLYLEPVEYRRRLPDTLTDRRDFDLSANRRYESLHGYAGDLEVTPPGTVVFFLGYEGSRMAQALEQEEQLKSWKTHAVFGIPAFQPGWEIDSLANNVANLIPEHNVRYANAASVEAAYRLLTELKDEDKSGNPIIVVPIGTKPHTIAASMFLVEHNAHDDALLIYDHPKRSQERSKDVRKWHLYDVHFNA